MSADCLLGTPLADLPLSVVPFLSVSVWRTCWCLSGLNLSVSLASVFSVSSVSVCLKCFPTSFARSFLYCQCLSEWACWCLSGLNPSERITCCCLLINPMSVLLVSIWWVMISVCLSSFSPFFFCQCLLGGTCWCLSSLKPSVILSF